MSTAAIQVHGLGKKYQISATQNRSSYRRLTEAIVDTLKAPFRRAESYREFWALRDVSFDVQPGEVLGIIGRNGAGKSTLLKIMSRITEPTEGEIILNGRVGSLLEVGTGFHPELTGRENIFLNGAILGMSRSEVTKKFDEIVDFAELAQFIDTPAKRYSSGMYMRLAFAVAAHLEPEILIVDEVLAVGDTEFQRKCIGKMEDVARNGRTIIFVSHNMSAIQNLCHRTLIIDKGKLYFSGGTSEAINLYLTNQLNTNEKYADLRFQPGRTKDSLPILTDVWLKDEMDGLPHKGNNKPLELLIRIETPEPLQSPAIGFSVEDVQNQRIFSVGNYFSGQVLPSIRRSAIIKCVLPDLALLPGTYFLNIAAGVVNDPLRDNIYRAVSFTVYPTSEEIDSRLSPTQHGAWRILGEWTVTEE